MQKPSCRYVGVLCVFLAPWPKFKKFCARIQFMKMYCCSYHVHPDYSEKHWYPDSISVPRNFCLLCSFPHLACSPLFSYLLSESRDPREACRSWGNQAVLGRGKSQRNRENTQGRSGGDCGGHGGRGDLRVWVYMQAQRDRRRVSERRQRRTDRQTDRPKRKES